MSSRNSPTKAAQIRQDRNRLVMQLWRAGRTNEEIVQRLKKSGFRASLSTIKRVIRYYRDERRALGAEQSKVWSITFARESARGFIFKQGYRSGLIAAADRLSPDGGFISHPYGVSWSPPVEPAPPDLLAVPDATVMDANDQWFRVRGPRQIATPSKIDAARIGNRASQRARSRK